MCVFLQVDGGNAAKFAHITILCPQTRPPDIDTLQDIDAGYFFKTDIMGTPNKFKAHQHRGHVLFQWVDSSLCEQSFTLTRKWKSDETQAWSEESGFTSSDVAVHGGKSCGELITSSDHTDDLTNSVGVADSENEEGNSRTLGMYIDYCAAAQTTEGKGGVSYKSNPACAQLRVFWESTIQGKIAAKGTGQPTPGVLVEWQVPGTSIAGTVISDGSGDFEIHIRDTLHEITALYEQGSGSWADNDGTVQVVAYVSKGNDPFVCTGTLRCYT